MNTKKKATIYIGASGWSHGWENYFPESLPSNKRLEHYSQNFRAVEVNGTFYQLPRGGTCKRWNKETTDSFLYTLKLSRYISHIKKLENIHSELYEFMSKMKDLGPKFGVLLIQLPPSVDINPEKIRSFFAVKEETENDLKMNPVRTAFEMRHRSWFEPSEERKKVLRTFEEHNANYVFAHSGRYPYPEDEPITTDFVYLRFHGPTKLFTSKYEKRHLEPWVPKIKDWNKQGLDVFVFFNNDHQGYALENTKMMKALAGE